MVTARGQSSPLHILLVSLGRSMVSVWPRSILVRSSLPVLPQRILIGRSSHRGGSTLRGPSRVRADGDGRDRPAHPAILPQRTGRSRSAPAHRRHHGRGAELEHGAQAGGAREHHAFPAEHGAPTWHRPSRPRAAVPRLVGMGAR